MFIDLGYSVSADRRAVQAEMAKRREKMKTETNTTSAARSAERRHWPRRPRTISGETNVMRVQRPLIAASWVSARRFMVGAQTRFSYSSGQELSPLVRRLDAERRRLVRAQISAT
jgi:hypothetical protein